MDAPLVERLPVVGVMGSGADDHLERCEALGLWLAGLDVHLLTGGGAGVMAAVSRAFAEVDDRAGKVLGVLPCREDDPSLSPDGYPNPWVEIVIRTHLPHSGARGTGPASRNHLNVLTADVLVALPGSAGTASEVALSQRYGRPLVAWVDGPDDIPGLAPEVPLAASLEEVRDFVTAALRRGPRRVP